MTAQLSIDWQAAKAQRDAGMARAADKAEVIDPTWAERALIWIDRYARMHREFISEECTAEAERFGYGVPEGADSRAWGQVFRKAARSGLIRKDGFGVSLRRHCSPSPRWVSMVYGRVA